MTDVLVTCSYPQYKTHTPLCGIDTTKQGALLPETYMTEIFDCVAEALTVHQLTAHQMATVLS